MGASGCLRWERPASFRGPVVDSSWPAYQNPALTSARQVSLNKASKPKMTCLLILLMLLPGPMLLAQETPDEPPSSQTNPTAQNLPAQEIGADDLLQVSVYEAPELGRTVRVSSDGYIRLPMLKSRILASGKLPQAVEIAIANSLQKADLLRDPVVTVSVLEYRSRPISVVGAVKRPVTFQAQGVVTLLDAIARAEGLAENAGSEILVSMKQSGESGGMRTLVQRVPIQSLIDAADPEMNLRLNGGEEIRVPEAGRIYVVGNVHKPGAYQIQGRSETTVLKALALSEGLLPYAASVAYIYRREAVGERNEIPIHLKDIIRRKSDDVTLLADDVLYIPDHTGKRAAVKTLQTLTSFGVGTLSGILVWH